MIGGWLVTLENVKFDEWVGNEKMHFLSLYIIIVKLIGKNYLKKQLNCKIYKSGVQIDSDNTV